MSHARLPGGELVEAEEGGVAHERVQAAGGVHVEVGVAGDVGAVASRGRAVDEEAPVRQDVVLEGDDGARVAGAVAEDARSASAAQPAAALASATVGDARALPYDDASADALVMLRPAVSPDRRGRPSHRTSMEINALLAIGGESEFLGHRRRDHRAVPLHGPLYGNHRPLFSRRPNARIAVVKGAAFSRACSSVIDAASSRWPVSHIRRTSTATTTITTNPITSSPTATVDLCSSSDQGSPHSYRGIDDGES